MKSEIDQVFDKIKRERGGIAKIHSSFREFPVGVSAHYEFYNSIVLKDDLPLSRAIREYVAFRVSEENQCPYCIGHHKKAFKNTQSELCEMEQALLGKLARIITKEPWKSNLLKNNFLKIGFSESQFQHAVMVASYFNFVNRCALAMGLDLEEDYEKTCN